MPANAGAQSCLDAVNNGWHNSTNAGRDTQARYLNRVGINVVPLNNPATVAKAIKDRAPNIPWLNETCSNSAMTRLTGTVTFNPLPTPLPARVGAALPGRGCDGGAAFHERTTIRGAVQRCSVVPACNFLQWEPSANSSVATSAMWTGVHSFRGCGRSGAQSPADTQAGFVLLARPARFSPDYDVARAPGNVVTHQISFQPLTAPRSIVKQG